MKKLDRTCDNCAYVVLPYGAEKKLRYCTERKVFPFDFNTCDDWAKKTVDRRINNARTAGRIMAEQVKGLAGGIHGCFDMYEETCIFPMVRQAKQLLTLIEQLAAVSVEEGKLAKEAKLKEKEIRRWKLTEIKRLRGIEDDKIGKNSRKDG